MDVPCPLKAIERNTAECQVAVLEAAMSNVPDLKAFESEFPVALRLPACDRFAANSRGEQYLRSTRGDNALTTTFSCEVHKAASSCKQALFIEDNTVSGVINIGLSLEGSGSLQTLRSILQSIFEEELQIVYSDPPTGDILKHRIAIHDTFLPIRHDNQHFQYQTRKRRFILSCLANSDLHSSEIVHHCSWNCCRSQEDTSFLFKRFVTWALLPHKMPVLQKKSWTSGDKSISWAGLLASHWNLLPKIFVKFTGNPSKSLGPLGAGTAPTTAGDQKKTSADSLETWLDD